MQGVNFKLRQWHHDLIREGRMCVNCIEPFAESVGPWPKNCPVCGFTVKADQMDVYAATYLGDSTHGSQIDWDEEFDRLDERREKRAWAEKHDIWLPNTGEIDHLV